MCDGGGDGNSGEWSMAIAAQVSIGAHLRVGVGYTISREKVRNFWAFT